ncbi:hypothetical protein KVT40_003507 [Elsinoe batatas]|uniref:Uncharacterized protein n=1 Tax=Elsinoe batatas TaxID=2601811 RepID=A0A8K0PIL8_9PEZI|nr:hypothetical protein KVT40_003507 [Elsinoe batatas]
MSAPPSATSNPPPAPTASLPPPATSPTVVRLPGPSDCSITLPCGTIFLAPLPTILRIPLLSSLWRGPPSFTRPSSRATGRDFLLRDVSPAALHRILARAAREPLSSLPALTPASLLDLARAYALLLIKDEPMWSLRGAFAALDLGRCDAFELAMCAEAAARLGYGVEFGAAVERLVWVEGWMMWGKQWRGGVFPEGSIAGDIVTMFWEDACARVDQAVRQWRQALPLGTCGCALRFWNSRMSDLVGSAGRMGLGYVVREARQIMEMEMMQTFVVDSYAAVVEDHVAAGCKNGKRHAIEARLEYGRRKRGSASRDENVAMIVKPDDVHCAEFRA